MRAAYPGPLQQIRNQCGPAWLANLTIQPTTEANKGLDASLEPTTATPRPMDAILLPPPVPPAMGTAFDVYIVRPGVRFLQCTCTTEEAAQSVVAQAADYGQVAVVEPVRAEAQIPPPPVPSAPADHPMAFERIDRIARAGYQYAAGQAQVPPLHSQVDIDAFNAGVSNFNVRHGTSMPRLREGGPSTPNQKHSSPRQDALDRLSELVDTFHEEARDDCPEYN